MKKQKRYLAASLIMALAIVSGAVAYWQTSPNRPESDPSHTATSHGRSIHVHYPLRAGVINNNGEIAGTFSEKQGKVLLYTINADKNTILTSGTLTPDEAGRFSRTISFEIMPKKGQKLLLTVFSQDNKGNLVDSLDMPVVFHN